MKTLTPSARTMIQTLSAVLHACNPASTGPDSWGVTATGMSIESMPASQRAGPDTGGTGSDREASIGRTASTRTGERPRLCNCTVSNRQVPTGIWPRSSGPGWNVSCADKAGASRRHKSMGARMVPPLQFADPHCHCRGKRFHDNGLRYLAEDVAAVCLCHRQATIVTAGVHTSCTAILTPVLHTGPPIDRNKKGPTCAAGS